MTIIRVNPASMTAYGREATEDFGNIHSELNNLVNAVTTVQFFGPNAVDFKTKSGMLAQEFAQNLHAQISGMAEAVRVSVSNIQQSLGGATVDIQVEGKTIEAPAVQSVDYVDVDTTALDGLKSDVTAKFALLRGFLDAHLTHLTSADWQGNAKNEAVGAVSSATGKARDRCTEAENSINKAIDAQVTAVTNADK